MKSLANRSAAENVARSATPASAARVFDNATMSGLYSMPSRGRAPLGGRDDRPAVTRTQVDQIVVRLQLRQIEHRLDQLLAGRHPDDVFALLPDGRAVRNGRRRLLLGGLGGAGGVRQREAENQAETSGDAQRMHEVILGRGTLSG